MIQLLLDAELGNLQGVKFSYERGDNIHMYNEHALRWSARNGHLEIVKFLVEHGANIHVNREMPLYWSIISNNRLKIVKYLIEKGADFHISHDFLFQYCAETGRFTIAKYLINCGADIHVKNDIVSRKFIEYGRWEDIEFLLTHKITNDFVLQSITNLKHFDIKYTVLKYFGFNVVSNYFDVVKHILIKGGDLKLVLETNEYRDIQELKENCKLILRKYSDLFLFDKNIVRLIYEFV